MSDEMLEETAFLENVMRQVEVADRQARHSPLGAVEGPLAEWRAKQNRKRRAVDAFVAAACKGDVEALADTSSAM